MKQTIREFARNEQGLETVESSIAVGLIVAGLVLVLAGIGAWVRSQVTELHADLSADVGSPDSRAIALKESAAPYSILNPAGR